MDHPRAAAGRARRRLRVHHPGGVRGPDRRRAGSSSGPTSSATTTARPRPSPRLGTDVVLEIEVDGAQQIRRQPPRGPAGLRPAAHAARSRSAASGAGATRGQGGRARLRKAERRGAGRAGHRRLGGRQRRPPGDGRAAARHHRQAPRRPAARPGRSGPGRPARRTQARFPLSTGIAVPEVLVAGPAADCPPGCYPCPAALSGRLDLLAPRSLHGAYDPRHDDEPARSRTSSTRSTRSSAW